MEARLINRNQNTSFHSEHLLGTLSDTKFLFTGQLQGQNNKRKDGMVSSKIMKASL